MYLIFFLLILLNSCSQPAQQECTNPLIDSVAVVTCISVVDGDTWKFAIRRDIFSVRVLNIDCFESRRTARLKEQAEKYKISEDSAYSLGQQAKALADSLLTNKIVKIVRDFNEDNFDSYNRLLRYCFINELKYDSIFMMRGLVALL